MRRAIARARLTRMTAEADRLAVLVAAIGIAAIAALEREQRDQARLDADASQFDRIGRLQCRWRWQVQAGYRNMRRRARTRLARQGRHDRWTRHPLGRAEPEPLGAA